MTNLITKQEEIRKKIFKLTQEYSEIFFCNQTFKPGETFIPPSGKLIGATELKMMIDACLDGWLTADRYNSLFEKKLSKFIGIKNLISVNSGSSANLVAFNTLTSPKLGERAIQKDDEVITVASGFPTTVNPIVQFGAIPVFIDINIKTHNIDVTKIEQAITNKTKAIMIAHTLGNPFELDKVKSICDKYNLWLVEDCCDALGAKFNNQMVGTWGDIATLSFYPAHHITMGEGGAVFTNSDELKMIAESFRDWGRDCYCLPGCDNTCGKRFDQKHGTLPYGYDHKYVYSHLGYNLKITEMQAACGLAQLENLENFIKTRKNNFNFLKERLSSLSKFIDTVDSTPNSDPSWFGFPITIKESSKINRLDLIKYLNDQKIGTRLLFAGNLIHQPSFHNVKYKVIGSLKNTDRAMNNTFWVGIQPALNETHLSFVADKIEQFFGLNF